MTKSILITGGAGLVGSNLTRLALQKGMRVSVLDNLENGDMKYLQNLDITFFNSDVLCKRDLKSVFKGHDLVVHLAAMGNVLQSIEDPISNFKTNVMGTINVLQACRDSEIKKIVFSSTGGALMGNTLPPVDENSLPDPISPYGASKLACEGYIKAFSVSFGIKYTIFRFGNVLGPNCRHKVGVINRFYKQVKNSEDLNVYGNVTRDFIFVDDLNDAILNSLNSKDAENQIFHLASGIETDIFEIAKKVEVLLGRKKSRIKLRTARLGEVERNFANISKAKKLLGLTNSKTCMEAVEEVINYLENEID